MCFCIICGAAHSSLTLPEQSPVASDLSFLIGYVELATKWKTIGDHLDVPACQLNAIQANNCGHPDMVQNCLREMFIWWINNGKEVTAEKVAMAVHAIGEHTIEAKVRERYGEFKHFMDITY